MGIIIWMSSPFFIQAQLLDPVTFHVSTEREERIVHSHSIHIITVRAVIDDGWYLYSIHNDPEAGPYPTRFSSAGTDVVIDGDITESAAEQKYDPNFDTVLGLHSGEAGFKIPVRFKKIVNGVVPIGINVLYQACDDISCLPPKIKRVTGEWSVKPSNGLSITDSYSDGDRGFGIFDPDSILLSQEADEYMEEESLFEAIWIYVIVLIAILILVYLFLEVRKATSRSGKR